MKIKTIILSLVITMTATMSVPAMAYGDTDETVETKTTVQQEVTTQNEEAVKVQSSEEDTQAVEENNDQIKGEKATEEKTDTKKDENKDTTVKKKATVKEDEYDFDFNYDNDDNDENIDENTDQDSKVTYITVDAESDSYNSIKLSWDKVMDVTGYKIYMSSKLSGGYKLIKTITDNDTTSYVAKKMPTNKYRYFKIRAYKDSISALASPNSGDSGTAAKAKAVLSRPEVSSSSVKSTSAVIKWKKVSGATGYYVYKYNASKKHYKVMKKASSKTRSYKATDLNSGKRYVYKVKAYRKTKSISTRSDSSEAEIIKTTIIDTLEAADKIIEKGKTKMGSRYVWGASGSSVFDCSGFVYWTLKNSDVSGVKITRLSSQGIYYKYKKYRVSTDLDNAKRGDLLLYGYGKSTHRIFHIGIYYGDGKYLHCTTGGRGVTITKVPTGCLAAIIRLPGLR